MSRIVGKQLLMGDVEKEVFRRLMWRVAEFSGVQVVTYAILSNHFHVVVRVPGRATVSDEELVRRYGILYREPTPWNPLTAERLRQILRAGGTTANHWRKVLRRRMCDLSWFVRTLKQRFSRWFNGTHDREGTLWADRFRSVLVEEGRALQVVSAYVDLNPVRAGLVRDPKDYRFCGYGEACSGQSTGREGLGLLGCDLDQYRVLLFGSGSKGKDGRACLERSAALRVIEQENGRLPMATLLQLRIRYLTEGRVLGSREFVLRMSNGPSPGRSASVRPFAPKGSDWGGLTILGGLHKRVFG